MNGGNRTFRKICVICGREYFTACRNGKYCDSCRADAKEKVRIAYNAVRRDRSPKKMYSDYICRKCGKRFRVYNAKAHCRKTCDTCLENGTNADIRLLYHRKLLREEEIP